MFKSKPAKWVHQCEPVASYTRRRRLAKIAPRDPEVGPVKQIQAVSTMLIKIKNDKKTPGCRPAYFLFCHCARCSFFKRKASEWHPPTDIPLGIFSGILSGVLHGILPDILSRVHSRILSDIYSDILFGILSGLLFGIYPSILSGIWSDILFGMCSGPCVPKLIWSSL